MGSWSSKKWSKADLLVILAEQSQDDIVAVCEWLNAMEGGEEDYDLSVAGSSRKLIQELSHVAPDDLRVATIACFDEDDEDENEEEEDDQPAFRAPRSNEAPAGRATGKDTTHRLYVIELDPSCVESRKIEKANPKLAKPSFQPKGFVYVGYTAHSAEYRFWQHCSGKAKEPTASPIVFKFGVQIRKKVELGACTPDEAKSHEKELATKLRADGYVVYSK